MPNAQLPMTNYQATFFDLAVYILVERILIWNFGIKLKILMIAKDANDEFLAKSVDLRHLIRGLGSDGDAYSH